MTARQTAADTAKTAGTAAAREARRQVARRAIQTAGTPAASSAGPIIAAVIAVTVVAAVVVFVVFSAAAARGYDSTAANASPAGGLAACAAALAAEGASGDALLHGTMVAAAESGCDATAQNPNPPTVGCPNGSLDRGPWQINDCYHPEVDDACAYDIACSAHETLRISSNGTNWNPWTTWRNGSAAAKAADAAAAIAALTAGGPITLPGGFTEPTSDSYQRLTPATKHLYGLVVTTFGVTDIGGWRAVGSVAGSDHPKGRAIDVMIHGNIALGQQIAGWAVANAAALQVKYVIHAARIWTPAKGWHPYRHPSDPCNCNPTLRHDDHVHISVLV